MLEVHIDFEQRSPQRHLDQEIPAEEKKKEIYHLNFR